MAEVTLLTPKCPKETWLKLNFWDVLWLHVGAQDAEHKTGINSSSVWQQGFHNTLGLLKYKKW